MLESIATRICFFIIGFGVALTGLEVFTTGGWRSGKFYFFSEYGASSKPFGGILFVIGIFICIQVIMGKWKKKQKELYYICPTCEESFSNIENKDLVYPSCQIELKRMEHYYKGQQSS
jgi:hypothetical protein